MQPDVISAIDDLDSTLTTIEKVLDLDELESRARELEDQAADPSLWDDPDHAQQITSQLSHVQARLKKVRGLRDRLNDLPVMYEMAEESEGMTPPRPPNSLRPSLPTCVRRSTPSRSRPCFPANTIHARRW